MRYLLTIICNIAILNYKVFSFTIISFILGFWICAESKSFFFAIFARSPINVI